MPFIRIKSKFTDLKFGADRPGYGSSELPYIKFTPPQQTIDANSMVKNSIYFSQKYSVIQALGQTENYMSSTPTEYSDLYKSIRESLDYPIRGGSINFQVGQETFTLSDKIDTTRIGKFFKDAPRGTAFIKKQVGLQLTNPKMETGNTLSGIAQGIPFSGLLENTRIYNSGRNTLEQIKYSGTGAHALRHGNVAFAPFQKHYYSTVNAQNVNNNPVTNRLVNLNGLKMIGGNSPFVNPKNVFDLNTVNTLGISLNKNLLFQYLGGPGSAYGIGATTIQRTVDTTKLGVSMMKSTNAMVYSQLKVQDVNVRVNGEATTNIQNYSDAIYSSSDKSVQAAQEVYQAKLDSLQERVDNKPGNKRLQRQLEILKNNPPAGVSAKRTKPWGNKTIDQRFYVSAGNYKDKLNTLYPFIFENSVAPWEYNKTETDDLIKFVFEAIDNDNRSNSIAIFFRAFLTSGITDNNSAQLNSFKYMGRGENFYTYQGFERTIGFSFRLAAGSKEELRPMYNRLNTLMSQVYPDYNNSKTGIMRAPIVRITVGDYIYRMPGFIESVNVTVDNSSPWEINLDGDSAQLPQVLDVALSFKPIMDDLPQRSKITNVGSPQTTLGSNIEDDFTRELGGTIQSNALIANSKTKVSGEEPFIKANFKTLAKRQATMEENIDTTINRFV